MRDQAIIKASLVHLLNERKLHEAMTADESGRRAASPSDRSPRVEAFLKERIPQELFTMDFGNGTLVEAVSLFTPISQILKEMREAEKAINDRAAALGWAGNPTSAFTVPQADGYVRHFQNASVYWTRQFGAREVHGAIRDRYLQMGAELSYLGFPQTDEISVVRSDGEEVRYSNFQGGSIFWTANRGAFLIPSFSPKTEKNSSGVWLHMSGTGFTPNNRVTLWIVQMRNNVRNDPQSIATIYAASDGRFGSGRLETWPVFYLSFRDGGYDPSIARALDEATGQYSESQLSYALY
jgi:hypothetical protein